MTPAPDAELWHLSMDDLLGPIPATFRLGGAGPFVINLRASNISISPIATSLDDFPHLHLYQIQRVEHEALRFRLRLGPFLSEDEADAVLLKVRDEYPCALTATAVADDLQAIELLQRPKPSTVTTKAIPVAATTTANPVESSHAAHPDIPVVERPAVVATASPPAISAPPAAPNAAEALRWFVIELAVTDQAVDPETVPNLDIYDLYRLYSVAQMDQGRQRHALRLGFFGEEIAAKAVASYLAGYYDTPIIKRVSIAERERFSQNGIEARKDVGETGRHASIEITGDRLARPIRRPVTPLP